MPPRGGAVDIFSFMVGAPGSSASPPRGPVVDVFSVDGGRS
jgi:hypothetical protein